MPAAKASACASSSAAAGRSKLSSTAAALTLLRRPCGLSTWNEAGACASTEPTFSSPASSYRTCTRELQDAGQEARKALEAVVAAVHHHLLGTSIALHRA